MDIAKAARTQSAQGGKVVPALYELISSILAYDEQTGELTWLSARGNSSAGSRAGSKTTQGYWQVKIAGRNYLAHRIAWLLKNGCWPLGEIDHIDRDKSNNRISNLRDVDHFTNMRNRDLGASQRFGVGVRLKNNRYLAQIRLNGKCVHLGSFACQEAAASAFNAALASRDVA